MRPLLTIKNLFKGETIKPKEEQKPVYTGKFKAIAEEAAHLLEAMKKEGISHIERVSWPKGTKAVAFTTDGRELQSGTIEYTGELIDSLIRKAAYIETGIDAKFDPHRCVSSSRLDASGEFKLAQRNDKDMYSAGSTLSGKLHGQHGIENGLLVEKDSFEGSAPRANSLMSAEVRERERIESKNRPMFGM